MTKKRTSLLDQVRVASPCNARWEDMAGDDRVRFCKHCSKHVFHLSALTRPEAERLLGEKAGGFCGRFQQQPDGRVRTVEGGAAGRHCRERLRWAGLTLVSLLVFLATGCRRPTVMGKIAVPRTLTGEVAVSPAPQTNPPPTMGDIAIVPASAPNSTHASPGP